MNLTVRLAASLIALTALGGCYVEAGGSAVAPQGEYVEGEAPPPPAEPAPEAVPVAPSPEHVWLKGHYEWRGHAYVWERGHYERRPQARSNWVPAHWEVRGRRRVWVNGHWG